MGGDKYGEVQFGAVVSPIGWACSSVLTYTTLLALVISCLTSFVLSDWSAEFKDIGVKGTLFVTVGFGFISLLVIFLEHWLSESPIYYERGRRREKSSETVRIITLWCLGLALIIMDAIYLAVYIECIDSGPYDFNVYNSVYRALKIMVFLLQLGWLSAMRFKRYHVVKKIGVSIIMVILMNCSFHIKDAVLNIDYVSSGSNSIYGENNTDYKACIVHSTTQEVVRSLAPFLYPIRREYLMLSGWFLMKLMPKLGSRSIAGKSRRSRVRQTESDSLVLACGGCRRPHERLITLAAIVLVIIFHIPIVVVVILLSFVYTDGPEVTRAMNVFEYSTVALSVVMILLLCIGFHVLDTECVLNKHFTGIHGSEFILLCGLSGTVMFQFLAIISSLHGTTQWSTSTLVKASSYTIFVYYQTIFVLYAKRCRIRNGERRSTVHKMVFISCFIGTADFLNWIIETLLGYNWLINSSKTDEGQVALLGETKWQIVSTCVLPFFLFYKFHCAMEFYDMYFTYRR